MTYRRCEMKTRYLSLVLTVILMQVIGSGIPAYSENTGPATNGIATGLEDQTGVAVTIYNANLGLVKDQRKMQLFQGQGDVRFMDVAAQIIPASVYIKSLVNPDSLRVLEQNYEYDLLNSQKLLDKYVGKEVKLYSKIRTPREKRW
jgi:hypothetical protein